MRDSTYMTLSMDNGMFSSARIVPDDGTYYSFIKLKQGYMYGKCTRSKWVLLYQ